MGEPLRVFISYHHSDRAQAGTVKFFLEREGFTCFLAHEDLEVSSIWRERIWEELTRCDCFIGLISEASNQSVWCQQETAVALYRLPREKLVLVMLGDARPIGFAEQYQAVRMRSLVPALDSAPMVREQRVNTMIDRLAQANSFVEARKCGRSLLAQIGSLTPDQFERFLKVSRANRQVWEEDYSIGPRIRELYATYEEREGEDAARGLGWTCDAPMAE